MTGRLYIDGTDIYSEYGAYVQGGGWNELVSMPPLKSVAVNDWQEEDGIEPDLSLPVLDTRDVQIKFACTAAYSRLFALYDLLSDGAYHAFDCTHIGRTYRLRLVGVSGQEVSGELATLTMKFADDFPLDGFKYAYPTSGLAPDDRFKIDGTRLSEYGLRVLKGSLSDITRSADVKPNMLRNIGSRSGAIYDPRNVTYKSKDVKLYCLMTAESLSALWRNYDALLYDLTRGEERKLWVGALERDFACYYKSCQVTDFFPEGKIWLQFTLTLTFIRDLRILDDDNVLATEDDIIIFTEDGQNAIDMQPDRYTLPPLRFVNDRNTLRLTGAGYFRFNN